MTSKLILTPKSFPSNDQKSQTLHLVPYRHPRNEKPMLLGLCSNNSSSGELFFIQKTAERPQSWILGSHIIQDGTCYFLSKFDSLFLWIPLLRKATFKKDGFYFVSERDLLSILDEESEPLLKEFFENQWKEAVETFCETTLFGDDTMYKFSQEKLNQWLEKKLNTIMQGLSSIDAVMEEVREECGSMAPKDEVQEKLMLTSLQILADFVSQESMLPLAEKKGLHTLLYPSMNKTWQSMANAASATGELPKKRKRPSAEPEEEEPKKRKPRMTPSQRRAKQVDTSKYRSLTDFFTSPKKNKKKK